MVGDRVNALGVRIGRIVTVGATAVLFACSGTSPTTGGNTAGQGANSGDNGTTGDTSGSSSGDQGSSSGSSNGSQAGTSSGSATGGSSGSKGSSGSASAGSTGSGSGTSTGGSADAGAANNGRGCGQATSCTPGNDLAVPAAADGVQIATPPGGITVQPGQEQFLCYYKNLPAGSTLEVGKIQSWMTPGSSHHFIAYQAGTFGGSTAADGSLQACAFGGGTWMYATSVPGEIIEMDFPDKVGLPVNGGTQIMLNMHFINTGTTAVQPQVKMNLLFAKNVQYQAAAMVSFNAGIAVPPATAAGPGKQTVSGTCTAPVGSNFFVMTTHTHKHAVAAEVNYVSGGKTTNIVNTTDWEHPDVGLWNAPSFLTTKIGDTFTYSCSYENTSSTTVTVGETAASNEMCMSIGYYYPAGSASCN